jgi:hypothetical protein
LLVSSDTQQSSSARSGRVSCTPQSNISDGLESQRDKMKIFLSYSSKDRTKAGEIALALQTQGHGVFFDSGGEKPPAQKEALANFVNILVYPPDEIKKTEYSLDPNSSFPRGSRDVVALEQAAFGRVLQDYKAFNVIVSVTNTSERPILLDLTQRFFELQDDQGRPAELFYFCCKASGETLGPGQQRQIQLLYRLPPGWVGKGLRVKTISFKITGLLPLLRGAWEFRPLATAN